MFDKLLLHTTKVTKKNPTDKEMMAHFFLVLRKSYHQGKIKDNIKYKIFLTNKNISVRKLEQERWAHLVLKSYISRSRDRAVKMYFSQTFGQWSEIWHKNKAKFTTLRDTQWSSQGVQQGWTPLHASLLCFTVPAQS